MTVRMIRIGRIEGDELVIEEVELDVEEFARRIAVAQMEAIRPVVLETMRQLRPAFEAMLAAFARIGEIVTPQMVEQVQVVMRPPVVKGSAFHAPIAGQQRRPKVLR